MANTTDYTRLLDGYTLLAIKGWVEGLLSYKAPLASPTFTGTVTLPTSVKIGTSTATGLVKYTNGTLSIDTNSYKTDYRYRPIQVAGTEKIGTTAATALNFLNGTHSVQFTYNSGLYAEVDLHNYKPNNTDAFLDTNSKVNALYLPDVVLGQLQYVGTWNATTPSWPSGRTKLKGEYWICNTAGGKWPDGTTATDKTFVVGDWAIWTGAGTTEDPYRWEKVDNTDAISSITLVSGNALTGPVTIPLATSDKYGLIKIGYSSTGKNYAVQLDSNGKAYVNVPWANTVTTSYGTMEFTNGLTIGDLNISVDGNTSTYNFVVPYATASQYGVVKVASVKAESVTVNSLSTTANRYYGVEMNTDGKLFVNVPWVNTTYSADGTTLSLSGTTFSIKSGYLAAVATSGSYNDLSNKPTIPATNVIPATTTANKLLLSTTTSGTAEWSSWSTAGFLKTNASGVVSIDTNSYSLSNHTHTLSIATDSGTNALTLAYGTKYKLTAGGSTFIFTMPSSDNTNWYPTSFSWTNGTTAGPTGSLTGTGMSAVNFGAIPKATKAQSGIVTTDTQTFNGEKSFLNGIISQDSSVQNLSVAIYSSYITFINGNGYTQIYNSNTAGGKYINVNTYSQNEAANILNGLNSDGTSI